MKKHHTHGKSMHSSGGVAGPGMDYHHRGKHGATGGDKPHNKVGSVGGSNSRSMHGKPKSAKGATTDQKGSRPIRLANKVAIRPTVSKRKKISHDTLI